MDGWMWYVCVYTREHYSAIKRRKYCYIDITDGSWGHDIRLKQIRPSKTNIYDLTYTRSQ